MTTQGVRIGIAGINGRVGRLLREEVTTGGGILSGGTARDAAPASDVFATLDALAPRCDVVIDFTHAATVRTHADILARAGVAWVLGTTGLSAADLEAVRTAAGRIPVVHAANYSPGVTLVTRLARQMAAALPSATYDAEILEMHHRQKVDAPSGTALAIGQAVADGRGIDLASHIEDGRTGHTGPRRADAIGFAVLRGGQIVGEHTVSFTSATEQIALTHRSFDRRIYATGAVRAALWLRGQASGLYDMEDVLGLD
ncbi:Dihydrodipicolinate reductase [Gluconacetobacter diazotrophicus PA1 5]|uniref:4-hydroxy-tetrahydrodipicolinate reductase n=2 Tax=Gluconacetobacter diazotrophicus TaxID=33996 RepID=DAPB_GLUDA|nr:4-hydroxy-tetrahydrodipicolinate reductase [Gluconacetobacter diazotrophicus]A9HE99.1 RecName: Full=4-hydroxy-tetrahydrodipicolinate reductase; Short=HTPA reductase [Gluconacetobacter diazotrophicus PA1 5]ACI51731.1 Dihydrodipicolinate reductase [Gluconacetobacter diazotrophicus PA1 5]MBB2155229.1 4-hydroxy-tetrahydrodipicolinate reductase [Gluconacetobacter diazotrophicus]TWB11075.1 dihydrodipicolinate reductase [Gluconacetobacter diazotrophicus]CAP55203.1 putative Dihydrodipicolinate redu